MAQPDEQDLSTENSTDESQSQETVETENPDEGQQADAGDADTSSTSQPDYEGRFKALEERLGRADERNRYLEQTARLLEQERNQYRQSQQRPVTEDPSLPSELMELDKTLDPIFAKRLQSITKPLVDTVSRLYDQQDADRFEMYLMRNHPEVFEEDGGIDKIFQEIESVRQSAAQNYNQWLSRVDAFLYAQGIRGVQQQAKTRKEKKSTQVREEAKRQVSVKAVQSGVQNVAPKKPAGGDIQSIRDKAQRGERLTSAERAKYRDYVAGVSF